MEVGIVTKRNSKRAIEVANEVTAALIAEDCAVRAPEAVAAALSPHPVTDDDPGEADLIVSIGGDGTFLHATHQAGRTPILGVNLGEVGFLNPVPPDMAERTVRDVVRDARTEGGVSYREANRLTASGAEWSLPPALNEVVVTGPRRGPGGRIDIEIAVDDAQYSKSTADGAIIATPTGSTAYNLSEGGPLVHPDVPGIVITEMAAADPMPPLVVGPDATVTVRMSGAEAAVVAVDGGHRQRLSLPEEMTVRTADQPVRIAGPRAAFFTALEKLD